MLADNRFTEFEADSFSLTNTSGRLSIISTHASLDTQPKLLQMGSRCLAGISAHVFKDDN